MKEAAFGNYLLHITGRNGNIVHHAGVLVEVGRKLESFHVRLQPSTMFVKRGEDFNVMVMIERNSGFSEGVTVWTMGTKALKIKVTPGVVSDVDAMTPFNLKTTKKTPLGTHKIMFVAKANSGRVETVTMNLTVTE